MTEQVTKQVTKLDAEAPGTPEFPLATTIESPDPGGLTSWPPTVRARTVFLSGIRRG